MPTYLIRATAASFALLFCAAAAGASGLPAAANRIVSYDISVTLDAEKKELTGRERIVWRNPSTDPSDAVSDL